MVSLMFFLAKGILTKVGAVTVTGIIIFIATGGKKGKL